MGPITSLRDIFSALRRRFWLILLICVIGAPLALLYALNLPRVYEATAVIQIESPRIAADLAGGSASGQIAAAQLDLIQQQLLSRDQLVAVIEEFDLFSAVPSMTERVGLLRGSIRIVRLIDPAQSSRPDTQPTGLIITLSMGDPQKAADVANHFVNTIVAEAEARSAARTDRTLAFLMAEEARVGLVIAEIEDRIAAYRQANVDSLPEGVTSQRDRLLRLNEQLIALDREILELDSDRDRLRAEEVERQMTLLMQQRDLILAGISTTEAAIDAAPTVERELGALNRQLEQLVAEFTVLTTRRTEAATTQRLENQDEAARFEVLETAIAPEYPISTSRRNVAIAGGIAVLGLALGLALALEVLNPVIRTAAQLEKELGVQPVIVVPYLRSRHARRRRRLLLAIVASGLAVVGAAIAWLGGWLNSLGRVRAPIPVTTGQ